MDISVLQMLLKSRKKSHFGIVNAYIMLRWFIFRQNSVQAYQWERSPGDDQGWYTLVNMWIRRISIGPYFCDIHSIKQIVVTAIITMHVYLPIFFKNGVDFFLWQRF
ncbi:hypothetical protein DES37_12049 [Mangrovibacter plantisponsor]|uniref:Uncharacterized protein n=1 Tax=Mangrovibacter plantisponsor TaxID=451513 RepID=A0A317PNJ1_9ENTR|nr:hypothetical protein DES37_12049 [Mangrovibacter plantisponsor]